MAKNLFSVPIFFIVFRETIEAAIIVSVLLSFVEQLMSSGALKSATSSQIQTSFDENGQPREVEEENVELNRSKRIIKRMRIQVWAGTAAGFGIALAIGAAFIAVFYTKVNDLWGNTEQIWEGVFSIIASILIYIMGLAFLKMDHSRVKWRIKLAQAFGDKVNAGLEGKIDEAEEEEMRKKARNGKWALFLLPFITVLREGLEAVVFVGGVSLGQPATSIPIAAIVGLIAGAIVGYLIYRTGSSFALHWFLVASTCVLFLIGAGLLSKGVGYFEYYRFAKKVGGDVSETGNGPGSYQVAGNVWHLTYGNPEPGAVGTNGGAQIANAIFGWTNNATIGTILAYVFFWLAVVAGLVYGKWSEGRVTFFGKGSKAYQRRMEKRQEAQSGSGSAQPLASPQLSEGQSSEGLGKTGSGSAEGDEIGVAPRLLKDHRMDSGFSEGEKDVAGYQKVAF